MAHELSRLKIDYSEWRIASLRPTQNSGPEPPHGYEAVKGRIRLTAKTVFELRDRLEEQSRPRRA